MKRFIFGIIVFFLAVLLLVDFSYGVNRVLSLDGNGDYVDLGTTIQLTDSFSICAWVKCGDQSNTDPPIVESVSYDGDLHGYRLFIENTNGKPGLSNLSAANGHKRVNATTDITDNNWHFIVATYDSSTTTQKMYIDGALEGTNDSAADCDFSSENTVFGKRARKADRYYDGIIDEISIWNKALAQEEIQTVMNEKLNGDEEGLVGYWNFDDGTADDLSSFGNHGTLMGDAEVIPGVNRALGFDGNGRVTIGDAGGDLDVGDNDNYSISLWFNSLTKADQSITEHWEGFESGGGYPWAIRGPYTTNGYVSFAIYDGTNNPTVTAKNDYANGDWHYLVAVRDYNADKIVIYIDGILEGELEDTTSGDVSANANGFTIGARHIETGTFGFSGKIDEVRIWNRALTQMEIWAQKDAILKGDEPGLVGYWRLDEEPGSNIAKDSSGNGNHGTVYGAEFIAFDDIPVSTGALVRIPNVSGTKGQTVNVPVIIENCTGIVSLDLVLNYDNTILIPEIAETTDLTTDWHIDSHETAAGTFKTTIANQYQPAGDGAMINIPFVVNPTAPPACITAPITIEQVLLNEGHIPVITFDGVFRLNARLGDVSLNGTITGYDAALVLQHTVEIIALTDCQQDSADVNISGEITAYDAALILQYCVGITKEFPVDNPPVAPALNLPNETKLLTKAIEQLDAAHLTTKEQQQILEQLKNLVFSQLVPKGTALLQNYPNPFNPETWIPFELSQDAIVTINIYDIAGRLVQKLESGNKPAGFHTTKDSSAYWNGRTQTGDKASSGLYFYTIKAGTFTATRKMILLK